jgi:predicted dehydrogenase
MATEERVRCAVVGLGRIASLLEKDSLREKPCTHVGAIAANPRCELLAGADIDHQRRELFREQWGCESVYADCRLMLAETEPDILVVATHPDSHLTYVSAAVRAGVPVAICEKPLADTLPKARRLAGLHESGRITVVTNHERRYSADYIRAREAVAEGRYGRLLSVKGTLYFGRVTRRDRMLLHDGTHLVDAINYLTGEATRFVRRHGALRSKRGSTFLIGRSGKVPVLIEVGSERDHLVFEVELSFESGRIRLGNGVERWEKSEESPYYEGYRSLLPDVPEGAGPTGYFVNMVADAVACVDDPGREPRSSALDALEVMKFIRRW